MIEITNGETFGWEHAMRGMRNPMNSWDKGDTYADTFYESWEMEPVFVIGPNDFELAMSLAKSGHPSHSKYRRMIVVYADITAPLYWWKEFDTYKVGTVANSCSTMHKIHEKEFSIEDFSHEHLEPQSELVLGSLIKILNYYRKCFNEDGKKEDWWQMIQLLPSSYNQKRTVMLNYEVLANIYISRKNHKLDEWHDFCDWIEDLPYSELITLKEEEDA